VLPRPPSWNKGGLLLRKGKVQRRKGTERREREGGKGKGGKGGERGASPYQS